MKMTTKRKKETEKKKKNNKKNNKKKPMEIVDGFTYPVLFFRLYVPRGKQS